MMDTVGEATLEDLGDGQWTAFLDILGAIRIRQLGKRRILLPHGYRFRH
jgi:hypothetical protein